MAVEIRAATYAALRTALAAGTYQEGQMVFVESIDGTNTSGAGLFQVKYDAGGGFVDDGGVTLTSADGKWAAGRLFDGKYDIRWFGASSSLADNASAIQNAIDAAIAASSNSSWPTIYIPSGNYVVKASIDRSGNGVYCDILGDGQRASIITASTDGANLSSVILLADAADVAGRTTIRGLSIFCEGNADIGIDAKNMRKWTMENVEIRQAAVANVLAGNWNTRIDNSQLTDSPIAILIDGIDAAPTSSNNLLITRNDISSVDVGLQSEHVANNIIVRENSFDTCENAGVFLKYGCRKAVIEDNYFEKCGNDGVADGGGVTIATGAATSESVAAPVVIGYDYSANVDTTFSGSIRNNFIAEPNSNRFVALYNVADAEVKGNVVLDGSTSEAVVDIRGLGVSEAYGRQLVVENASPAVTKPVALNALLASGHSNIVVRQYQVAATTQSLFLFADPKISELTGATTINESWYGGFKEYEFDAVADGGTTDRVLTIDFTGKSDHPLLGRYIRVHYKTKGVGAEGGVRCRISISGSTVLDIARTATAYVEAGRGRTIYIPTNATSLEVRLDSTYSGVNGKMIGFRVCDAAFDL